MNYRHIIHFLFLILSTQCYAQLNCVDTVYINTISRDEGNRLAVDFTVDNFVDLQSIQFGIGYDETSLEYDSAGNFSLPGLLSNSFNLNQPGAIRMLWFDNTGATPQTLPSGSILFTLYFNPLSSVDTEIQIVTFDDFTAEGSNSASELICINSTTHISGGNGNNNGNGNEECLDLDLIIGSSGIQTKFSIEANNFSKLNELHFEIVFDKAHYIFDEASNFGNLSGLNSSSIIEQDGKLIVSWINPALNGISLENGSILFDISFTRIQEQTSTFSIAASTTRSSAINDSNEIVCFEGDVRSILISTTNPEDCVDTVYIDLVATNGATELFVDFITYNFTDIDGMQFTIDYDPNHLEFTSVASESNEISAINFNEVSAGKIGLAWLHSQLADGFDNPDGTSLFQLKFKATSANESVVSITNNPVEIELIKSSGNNIIYACLESNETSIMSQGALLSGYVQQDLNNNCITDEQSPMSKWIIQFSNEDGTFYSSTDTDGYYQALVKPNSYIVSAIPPNNLWGFCENHVTSITTNEGDIDEINFSAIPQYDCPLMYVDISTPFLRRCFDNRYVVNYCNYGTALAEDVFIEIALDENLIFVNTAFENYTLDASTNVLRFDIGTMEVNACQELSFVVNVSCEAALGQTHCAEASIYPAEDCSEDINGWSGASLHVMGICDEDSVRFIIQNTGMNDMLEPTEFIVIEDDVMFNKSEINLPAGLSQELSYQANGATYRVEIEQVRNHPGSSKPSAFIEGCNPENNPNLSIGFATMFPLDDQDPWKDIDCQENIGSYDPNDKIATPKGVGDEHFIKKNTDLSYKIRFQNTGTDTAFKVVIIDTLSTNVDISTFRVGAASHNYELILRNQVVQFVFNDIQLVDSFTNEPGSHGFINYTIQQKDNLEDGNTILNKADIYFDFNLPILTNTTFHEIGSNFIEVINTTQSNTVILSSQIYPNPMIDQSFIELDNDVQQKVELRIIDALGRTVRIQSHYGSLIPIYRDNLINGIYYYEVRTSGVLLSNGSLIIQ